MHEQSPPPDSFSDEKLKLWYLARIDLFADLSRKDLKVIAKLTPMCTVAKGTLVVKPDDETPVLYLLKRGKVRLFRVTPNGKQFTHGILGAGNVFGELESLSTCTHDYYVEALEDCLLCRLLGSDLEALLAAYPRLAITFLQHLSNRLRDMEDVLEAMALGTAETRLVFLMARLAEQFSVRRGSFAELDLALTHEELADMVGTSRETVSRTISAMKRAGVLKVKRRRMLVDLDGARRLADSHVS